MKEGERPKEIWVKGWWLKGEGSRLKVPGSRFQGWRLLFLVLGFCHKGYWWRTYSIFPRPAALVALEVSKPNCSNLSLLHPFISLAKHIVISPSLLDLPKRVKGAQRGRARVGYADFEKCLPIGLAFNRPPFHSWINHLDTQPYHSEIYQFFNVQNLRQRRSRRGGAEEEAKPAVSP